MENQKQRTGAVLVPTPTEEKKKFWQGTNFWLAAVIFGGSFIGAPESLSTQVVMSVVGVVAAAGAMRQFLPNLKFDSFKARLKDANTWNYLTGLVATVGIPALGDLIPPLHDLSDAFIAGNWGLVISRGMSFLTIAYFLFIKKPAAPAAT